MTFRVLNDVGAVMATRSTRKKAMASAKRAVRKGSRFASVSYRLRGEDRVAEYASGEYLAVAP